MRLLLHENQLTLSITKREHEKLQVGLNTLHNGLIKVLFQDMLTVYINHQKEMAVIDYIQKEYDKKHKLSKLEWNE
jgi:hypothetical protein